MSVSARTRIGLAALVVGLTIAAAVVFWPEPPAPEIEIAAPSEKPLPVHSDPVASPYLNTAADVAYVGSQACRDCHQGQHASFLATPHSRALQSVDEAELPEPTEFEHSLSGRAYRAVHGEDAVRHQEVLQGTDGSEFVLNDYPISYAIGSGHHSQSYLVELDGFLVESPITWYASRQAWDMSPGYDRKDHSSFERLADVGCVSCHACRVEAVDGNMHRVQLHESVIGCESCHGPGEKHVALHTAGGGTPKGATEDLTIVNPQRLSRELQESVCGNCHLRGAASVLRSGRQLSDYRPGLPLTEVRIDYAFDHADSEMTVVGHVEQMRLSRCYTETDSFTCTTCHDPHDRPAPDQRIAHYRNKCLDCHGTDNCGLPVADDRRVAVTDNCIACHMPTTDTDLPHFAFTHHRVGIHADRGTPPPAVAGRLVPMENLSHLTRLERERSLGLAYLEYSDKQSVPTLRDVYRRKAVKTLAVVWEAGFEDGEIASALARLQWEKGGPLAIEFAQFALESPDTTSRGRINALIVTGDLALQARKWEQVSEAFQQLTIQRRHADDWKLLAESQWKLGRQEEAIASLRKAVSISPDRVDLRTELAQRLGTMGDAAGAKSVRDDIAKLEALLP